MSCELTHAESDLSSPRSAEQFFRRHYKYLNTSIETLLVAHLDQTHQCVHLSAHEGNEFGVLFPIKSIVRDVIDRGSAGLLLAHNHPSGASSPSENDLAATRRLSILAEALDCVVLDHFVLAGGDCASLRSLGLL